MRKNAIFPTQKKKKCSTCWCNFKNCARTLKLCIMEYFDTSAKNQVLCNEREFRHRSWRRVRKIAWMQKAFLNHKQETLIGFSTNAQKIRDFEHFKNVFSGKQMPSERALFFRMLRIIFAQLDLFRPTQPYKNDSDLWKQLKACEKIILASLICILHARFVFCTLTFFLAWYFWTVYKRFTFWVCFACNKSRFSCMS